MPFVFFVSTIINMSQVTIALATFRDFPWRKVPIYILAQLLGAIAGAAVTYANYYQAITLVEGGPHTRTVPGTASLFGAYAVSYPTHIPRTANQANGSISYLYLPVLVSLQCLGFLR